jgi:tRNA A37 threonylcarbamoyladenosine modification protein TsaB
MKKLYLDTSTDVMYIILADKNELIDTAKYLGKRDHATFLVNRIDQIYVNIILN